MLKWIASGTLGAAAGLAICAGNDMLKEDHKKRKLVPQPEAFDVDPQSYTIFHEIQKVPGIDSLRFATALDATDVILLREYQLRTKHIQPTFEDMPQIEAKVAVALSCMDDLVEAAETVDGQLKLEQLRTRLREFLFHHLGNIERQCRTVLT